MISKLASKEEVKEGLMRYFGVSSKDSKSYYVSLCEERLDDCFDISDMDEIDENRIDYIIEYIFKDCVKEF